MLWSLLMLMLLLWLLLLMVLVLVLMLLLTGMLLLISVLLMQLLLLPISFFFVAVGAADFVRVNYYIVSQNCETKITTNPVHCQRRTRMRSINYTCYFPSLFSYFILFLILLFRSIRSLFSCCRYSCSWRCCRCWLYCSRISTRCWGAG